MSNNVLNILRNPVIKIIGTILVLYYALFHNNKNPESMANRFSSTNIQKNVAAAKQNSVSIIHNIERAKLEAKEKQQQITIPPQQNSGQSNNNKITPTN